MRAHCGPFRGTVPRLQTLTRNNHLTADSGHKGMPRSAIRRSIPSGYQALGALYGASSPHAVHTQYRCTPPTRLFPVHVVAHWVRSAAGMTESW